MATVVCIPIQTEGLKKDLLALQLPVLGKITAMHEELGKIKTPGAVAQELLGRASAMLGPYAATIKLVQVVVALISCVLGIVKAMKRPTPGNIRKAAKCPKELAKIVKEIIELIPPFAYLRVLRDLLILLTLVLDDAIRALAQMQTQIRRLVRTVALSTQLKDTQLVEVAACAKADVKASMDNVTEGLEALGALIGLIGVLSAALGSNGTDTIEKIDAALVGLRDGGTQLGAALEDPSSALGILVTLEQSLLTIRDLLATLGRLVANPIGTGWPDSSLAAALPVLPKT